MERKFVLIYFFFALAISFLNYFYHYYRPSNLFWDENYHLASAYKYLNGIPFMADHPPLGKLFIALGEKMFNPNQKLDTSYFYKTDYIKDVPTNFSFVGIRFFPALFATLSIIPFFLILYLISQNPHIAFLFSSLYLFENALIVHSRGAMLDSTQTFFVLLSILYFIILFYQKKPASEKQYFLFGLFVGLVIATKFNGVFMFLFFPFLYFYQNRLRKSFIDFIKKGFLFGIASTFVLFGAYTIHISLTEKNVSIWTIPSKIWGHLLFVPQYEKGVPKLDICKPDENGSSPITWAFGNKSINYRWEIEDNSARYLYLQGNPLIWFFGIFGVVVSVFLLVPHLFYDLEIKNKKTFYLIIVFTSLYLAYMGFMMSIPRVMYLYHYFVPLIISFIIFFLLFNYKFENLIQKNNRKLLFTAAFFFFLIILVFFFFSPFTYYFPLTHNQFEMRNWFSFWHLQPIN